MNNNIFYDHRGYYINLWENIDSSQWKEGDISVSKRNVLRGIHGTKGVKKLCRVLFGRAFVVLVHPKEKIGDIYPTQDEIYMGPEYGPLEVPAGWGLGLYVLSEYLVWHYLQSKVYGGMEEQFTINWKEVRPDYEWPFTRDPITSERDK